MSTFTVPITRIKEITAHNNADLLEIAKVYDYKVVVGKGQYKPGDYVMYVPVDAILPQNLEDKVFSDSKIKLNKHRVRSIKIRGQVSQGLLIDLKDAAEDIEQEENGDVLYWGPGNDFGAVLLNDSDILDKDVGELYNIVKYEPKKQHTKPLKPDSFLKRLLNFTLTIASQFGIVLIVKQRSKHERGI